MNLANPLFLIMCGIVMIVELAFTPGIQPISSMIAGGLIGWNISRNKKGDS